MLQWSRAFPSTNRLVHRANPRARGQAQHVLIAFYCYLSVTFANILGNLNVDATIATITSWFAFAFSVVDVVGDLEDPSLEELLVQLLFQDMIIHPGHRFCPDIHRLARFKAKRSLTSTPDCDG